MVCKKDVITWFKGLKSYKRIDVMSILLNLCLPFELRFLGTCLEHLGKRDFHELRQSENEANNLSELNSAELQCLSSQQVRTKLAVYVSLLYSCNYTCSNYVYKILTKNEDIHSVLKAANEDTVLDDLLLIYTLAVNHPGFSVDQKLNLEKILTQLREEERRLSLQTANRNKMNFVAASVQDTALDKPPPPIQGYITTIEDHFIGMTSGNPHCPPLAQHPHFPGDGGGGGATLTSYPMTFPWALIPAQESPLSRTSSPNSGSPPPPRLKFPPPPPRAPPSALPSLDQLRESIAKEIPAYATVLHSYTPEQLGRMCDEELREMGLAPSAVIQLRAILSKQTNGIGSAEPKKKTDTATEHEHEQGVPPRLIEGGGGGTLRRFPAEAVAVYPGVYSCVTLPPPRKFHHHPFYPATATAPHQFDFRQMRITASEPSSSDESSPDTPPPHGEGVCVEERLTGGSGNGGGGGEDRRVGGRGRSRHHPPGRPAPQRARGPHPSTQSRRREVNMSNGAGNSGGGGGGNDPSGGYYPPQGYLPPHYLRSPYPGGYPTGGGGGGFVRAYPPAFQQPNGEVVYTTYPPPTGYITTGGYAPLAPQGQNQVLQQPPPPPPAPAPIQQPPNKPPPHPSSCYNCGSQSHCAIDCPDSTIEEVTKQGQYRIDFSGGYQKPVSGSEQHAAEK